MPDACVQEPIIDSYTRCDPPFLGGTRLHTALGGCTTLLKQKEALFKELVVRAMYLLLGTDEKLTLPNLVGTRSLTERCRHQAYSLFGRTL